MQVHCISMSEHIWVGGCGPRGVGELPAGGIRASQGTFSSFFRPKIDNFQRKFFDIFLIFAQNIDCGYTLEPPRRGGSNEYPQSMFWSKNKKNRYTLAYPSFAI